MVRKNVPWAAISLMGILAGLIVGEVGCRNAASQQPTQSAQATDTVITHDPGPSSWGYHGGSSHQGYSPVQPIAFPHPKHVKGLGLNCIYCHYAAYKSPDPGLPAVGTCMGCHAYTYKLNQNPEIKKLQDYAAKNLPIPWVRIHKLPDYVHFPHMRHVNAGVTCQMCHGQVQEMYRVYQYSSLNMGWCISCHVNGYNPKDGDAAAGSAREFGPPGAEVKANLSVPKNIPRTPSGVPIMSAAGLSVGPPLTEVPHRARYDCSTCHF